MEELENVPRGHGNIKATYSSSSPGIRLNPEATRAEKMAFPGIYKWFLTGIASFLELIGLLKKSNSWGILQNYLSTIMH